MDWDGSYQALTDAGYKGAVGLESLCGTSDAMRAATCVWRTLARCSDSLLTEGLKYLESLESTFHTEA